MGTICNPGSENVLSKQYCRGVQAQLYFEDALTDEILAQGEYAVRGRRDTTNASDSIFRSGGATAAAVVFSTAKRADGVLHAWKVLSVRGS